ncbi:MAG TPA: hypothetical protein VIV12_07805 [Streptosporangiaceae bacterium]
MTASRFRALGIPWPVAWLLWLLVVIILVIVLALVVHALGGFDWVLRIGHFHWQLGVS